MVEVLDVVDVVGEVVVVVVVPCWLSHAQAITTSRAVNRPAAINLVEVLFIIVRESHFKKIKQFECKGVSYIPANKPIIFIAMLSNLIGYF